MPRTVSVVEPILNANDQLAALNRELLDEAGVVGLNVMASPGAGKTSLIVRTIEALREDLRIGVVNGDVAAMDAERVAALGVPGLNINTGGACHLDARMVAAALPQVPLRELDLLIIENVGNLVCPAAFDLGAHFSALVASTPEGDDKPYKYPRMYRGVDALVINKIDLLPHVTFDAAYFREGVAALNDDVHVFELSCQTGDGVAPWIEWVRGLADAKKAPRTVREG